MAKPKISTGGRRTLAALIEARKAALGGQPDRVGAAACGASQATFTRWRLGTLLPSTGERVDALAVWLGVPVVDVVMAIDEGRRRRPTTPRDTRLVVAELEAKVAALEANVAAMVEAEVARVLAARATNGDAHEGARHR